MEQRTKPYDKRTIDRYIDKGQIKRADVDSYLKSLPDDAANATYVEMDLEDEEMGADGELDETDGDATDTAEEA